MGYFCPPRQTTAEFLTAVTDPNGRYVREGMEGKVPETADQFVEYWKKSPHYSKLIQQIEEYNARISGRETVERFQNIKSKNKMKRQRNSSRYLLTYGAQLRLAITRGFQRVKGDMAYTVTNIAGSIIQSLIMGSLFYNIPDSTSGAFSRGGVIFFALLFNSLSSLAEIGHAFHHRPILMKQKSYSFYHPSVEALQAVLSDMPTKTVTLICFTLILYFMTNLNVTAGQFFFFLLVLWITTLCIAALFQMVSSINKTAAASNSIAGLLVLLMAIFTGYFIPKPDEPVWFSWISWLDPVQYGFESLMANEFHGRKMPCDLMVPSGPGYENVSPENQVCAFLGAYPGAKTVSGDRYLDLTYTYSWSHAWRNFGIIIAFWIFFTCINTIATEYLRPVSGGGDVLLFQRGHLPAAEDIAEGKVADEQALNEALGSGGARNTDIFSWQNVNYTIPLDGGHRKLLNNVSGYVKPGTMTALVGSSGAGKTTLQSVLAQRVSFGEIEGNMMVNGSPVGLDFQRRTGFVQQQDLHLSTSTVYESLLFAARLRQPASVPDSEKVDYVNKVVKLLGMEAYSEAYVGGIGRGLNVEQRKKLSIGVELVAKPSLLLFLDEPTSGLDSQSANSIIKFLRSLANAGQAIMCTIHQPSATLFEEFDRLLLLQRGGETIYFGDIGENSSTLLSYFERQGARKCEDHENPAEYILECIGAGATAHVAEDWHEIWKNSDECRQLQVELDQMHKELVTSSQNSADDDHAHLTTKFAAPYIKQFWYVYLRTATQFWRSPTYIIAKFLLMTVGGLFLGFTFWDADYTLQGQKNAMFGLFMIAVLSAPLTNQIQEYAMESRDLFEARESSSNTFHWSTLLLSQFIAEMPYHLVCSTVLFVSFYFPVQYDTSARVAGFFFFNYCILFQMYYVSFALWIAYFSPDAASANIIASVLFTFLLSFCGVLQPVSQMPGFWTFMYHTSSYTYIIQNLLSIVLHGRKVACDPKEFNILQPPSGMTCREYVEPFTKVAGGYVANLDSTSDCRFCQYAIGDEFLATVGASYNVRWRNVGLICAYIVFNVCAMLVFYYLLRIKTWKAPTFLENMKKKKKAQQEAQEEHQRDIYAPQEGDEELVRSGSRPAEPLDHSKEQ